MKKLKKKNAERISKIKSFINKHNWEGINYLPKKNDLKKFEIEIALLLNVC